MLKRLNHFIGAFVVICSSAQLLLAESNSFRVETDVSIPGEPKPVQQSLTLFKRGVAYDFSRDEPEQITMVDAERGRIVLFDSKRKIQLPIDMAEFNAFMQSARNEAAASNLSVYVDDAQLVHFDAEHNSVRVGEKVLRYDATMQEPPEPAMASLYAQFADTSARLNAMRAMSPPPFARTALNAAIAEKSALPLEITRTTLLNENTNTSKENVVTCRLHANWRLSKDDETQITEIGKMLANFEQVSPAEFFKKPTQGAGQ